MENLKESNESRGRQQNTAITHPSWRFSSDVLVMLVVKDLVVMLVVKDLVVMLVVKDLVVMFVVKDLVVMLVVKDLVVMLVVKDLVVMLVVKDLVVMLVVKGKLSKAKSNKLKLITLVASCEGRSCLHGYSKIQEHFPCKRLVMLWYENYKS